jgi:hypothetical protein
MNKVLHSEHMYMHIGDYYQKMEMPYFVAKQPGDTASYCMSPLTSNCFGLVNPTGMIYTVEDDPILTEWRHMLHGHVYAEGVAAGSGGNNVGSLLIKNLHDSGLLDPTKGRSSFMQNNSKLSFLPSYLILVTRRL